MAANLSELRVHLDHLIRRQSIRYIAPKIDQPFPKSSDKDTSDGEDRRVRYTDIRDNFWFKQIRKPDFQRETNAWTPEDCVSFLDLNFCRNRPTLTGAQDSA